jgi:hypothetical protein
VSAQITLIETAMNRIAQIGYRGSQANATSAASTAMITPMVRAHTSLRNNPKPAISTTIPTMT